MSRKFTAGGIVSAVIMGVLAAILLPVLIINLTLIIKGSGGGMVPPDVFGIAPLAVTSGSMEGDRDDSFSKGALIFVDILDESEKNALAEGDIVTYYLPDDGGAYVTHRIVSVVRDGQTITEVTTCGDANNGSLDDPVSARYIVGKCVGHVEGLGDFAMFLQTPTGIIVFVGIPVVAFIAFDVVRITLYNRKVKQREQADKALADKDEEIARLRALVEERGGDASPAADETAPVPQTVVQEPEKEPEEPAYDEPVSDGE